MKPVMYHYVRPVAEGLPHFPYLKLSDFEHQLDNFGRLYGFVSRDALTDWINGGLTPNGVLLTFDDGLRDHVDFVLPVLKERNLFGLFYIPTGPLTTGQLLDVHKVHLALGRLGSSKVLDWLKMTAPAIIGLTESKLEIGNHYLDQESDQSTKFVKDLFNWVLSREERCAILDALLDFAFAGAPPGWDEFYLDQAALGELVDAGMGIGAHSHTHEVASRLSPERQKHEIELSCALVEELGGSRQWGYCYPHGISSAFSTETQRFVAHAGCPLAFAVRPDDIVSPLALTERYALPRHNCNLFPYGSASWGHASSLL